MTMTQVEREAEVAAIVDDARPSLEDMVASAVEQVREFATEQAREIAETGDDDVSKAWVAHAMDRRLVYVMGVVDGSEINLWMMDPPTPGVWHPGSWYALHAHVSLHKRHDVTRSDLGDADLVSETKAHTDAAEAIGWMYRDICGTFPKPQAQDD